MSRIVMKNGDIVNLESYDWSAYQSPALRQTIVNELRTKVEHCKNDYPGQRIVFCFNSDFGTVPDQVRNALASLGVAIESWP